MPDAEPINYRLNDLKLRWQRDPSSRLFLQLANEHRKAGQIEEAVEVLRQGLEHRPHDLSALVVLGRSQLELERAEEALSPLETVVSRDPTHLVASKLLIEAHLQRGDAEQASECLHQYRLLNDRDPELDHLQYRLERLQADDEQEASTVAGGELEGSSDDSATFVAEELAEEPAEVAALDEAQEEPMPMEPQALTPAAEAPSAPEPAPAAPEPAPSAGADLFSLSAESPAPDLEALWQTLPTQRPPSVEPFVGLSSLDAASHWDLMSREGIFASPGAAEETEAVSEATATPEASEATHVTEMPATSEPAIEPRTTVEARPVVEAEPVIEAEPVLEREPAAEPEAAIEPEPAIEQEAAIEAEPVSETEPVPEVEPAIEAADVVAEPAPVGETADDVEPDEEPATVTLGELYMRQGHHDEAKRIFEKVLNQHPGNRTALAYMAKLSSTRPGKPLSAADLLAVRSASAKIPEGLTAKKVLVLSNYVKHLRAGAAQAHV